MNFLVSLIDSYKPSFLIPVIKANITLGFEALIKKNVIWYEVIRCCFVQKILFITFSIFIISNVSRLISATQIPLSLRTKFTELLPSVFTQPAVENSVELSNSEDRKRPLSSSPSSEIINSKILRTNSNHNRGPISQNVPSFNDSKPNSHDDASPKHNNVEVNIVNEFKSLGLHIILLQELQEVYDSGPGVSKSKSSSLHESYSRSVAIIRNILTHLFTLEAPFLELTCQPFARAITSHFSYGILESSNGDSPRNLHPIIGQFIYFLPKNATPAQIKKKAKILSICRALQPHLGYHLLAGLNGLSSQDAQLRTEILSVFEEYLSEVSKLEAVDKTVSRVTSFSLLCLYLILDCSLEHHLS